LIDLDHIKNDLILKLEKYKRPGSPIFDDHFKNLPQEIKRKENVPLLISILVDKDLSAKVRRNAAGALGEIGDKSAIDSLISSLSEKQIQQCAAIALGRMKSKESAEKLKELVGKVNAATWAISQFDFKKNVDDAIYELRVGQLRNIPKKLDVLPDHLKKKVENEIIRRFKESISYGDTNEDLRWYVTALTSFKHPDAPHLLSETLKLSWQKMGSLVGLKTKKTCCSCLHNRTLRALKMNPSLEAVPNLVESITNQYQRHTLMALKRLHELEGGGLTDDQIANMIEKNLAIKEPVGSKRKQILSQLTLFAKKYGGLESKKLYQT
jgi:hypothetical protein